MAEGFTDTASQIGTVLHGPQRKQGDNRGSHSDVGRPHVSLPRGVVGYKGDIAHSQMLPVSFVVSKQEELVLLERAAQRASEYIALELGDFALVEEISGVQIAVAQELVDVPVELVGSAGRNDADLRARTF